MTRNHLPSLVLLILLICSLGACAAFAQEDLFAKSDPAATNFSQQELIQLAAPIALYPDQLLQIMLPASTFPEQIIDASLLIRSSKDAPTIEKMDWDASVKAVASYPGVLKMMSEKLDWTKDLGRAFLGQHKELLSTIQTLRLEAKKVGNLNTTDEQKVVTEKAPSGETVIRVESADPEVVYVPTYNPSVVYTETAPQYSVSPLVTFGLGMALGSALSDDDDDDDVNVYYGGGSAFWYNDDAYDDWVDYRKDRWNDVNDYYKDRQEFRQNRAKDAQDFRQDYYKEHGTWPSKGEYPKSAERQQAYDAKKQQWQEKRGSYSKASPSQRQEAYNSKKQQWQQQSGSYSERAAQARSSASAKRSSSGYSSGAFQGYTRGSLASSYSSRGAASRSSASRYSGASRGSGSRGGFSGGGGRSRGGGGGRRR